MKIILDSENAVYSVCEQYHLSDNITEDIKTWCMQTPFSKTVNPKTGKRNIKSFDSFEDMMKAYYKHKELAEIRKKYYKGNLKECPGYYYDMKRISKKEEYFQFVEIEPTIFEDSFIEPIDGTIKDAANVGEFIVIIHELNKIETSIDKQLKENKDNEFCRVIHLLSQHFKEQNSIIYVYATDDLKKEHELYFNTEEIGKYKMYVLGPIENCRNVTSYIQEYLVNSYRLTRLDEAKYYNNSVFELESDNESVLNTINDIFVDIQKKWKKSRVMKSDMINLQQISR